ncbi:hypothetical protein S4A8_04603 [Salinisphaera sp. S4-8]|uniref:AbrB/MazE/SpoVT family DNA-binding domain-containing protein n=1 Tax=Salinisphaera sp. S4-8 TaxID=633357 RepID=UPI00333F2176
MSTATLSSKGQITIPVAVRAGLGIDTGDRVEFVEVSPGHYELVAATLPTTALKGLIGKPEQPVSVEDMNTAVRQRAAKAVDP